MLKRELKINFKSFLIWLIILVVLFLVVFLFYPYMITDETKKSIDELMKVFPPEVLKAFNMDLTSIETAYGWLKSEGFMFVLLIVGFYASMLGGTILLKEENDKTIEYLGMLPRKRKDIITNKVFAGVIYIILLPVLLGFFNYFGLLISGSFDHAQFVLLSLTPILIGLPFFALNLFLSTFLHKTKKILGISLGMVFLSYFLTVLSEISSKVEFLKYFSIYTLADTRNVVSSGSLNMVVILISFVLTGIFLVGTYYNYEKKELIS